jgi:hypothetical protein
MPTVVTMRILGATYVEYPGGSLLGKVLAVATLLPAFAYCSLFTLLIALRSVRALSVLIGLVLSHLLNAGIKLALDMPRPDPFPDALHPLTTPGMVRRFVCLWFCYQLHIWAGDGIGEECTKY